MNIHYFIKNEKTLDVFKSFLSKSYKLTPHKYFEIEIYSYDWYLIEFNLVTGFTGRDHGGVEFEIGILGKYINLKIYDHRHWDMDKNTWVDE